MAQVDRVPKSTGDTPNVVSNNVANSVEYEKTGGGILVRNAEGSSITTLTPFIAEKSGGHFSEIEVEAGTDYTITLNGRKWRYVHTDTFPARFFKFKGNAAGSLDIIELS